MELVPLPPITRVLDVETAEELDGLAARLPGPEFVCYHPHGTEHEGYLDEDGRPWLRGRHGAGKRAVLDVIRPPFRVAAPVAPPVTVHDETQVTCSVLHTSEELAAYRSRFAAAEGGTDAEHQAHAVDGRGRHWTLVATEGGTTVRACRFRGEADGVTFAEAVLLEDGALPLPVTVVEID
ncbi:hypothetical protein ACH9EU_01730 [Kocuria sp. M1R5S2]|uniref:hypothetical protein n=1 Tax=Kocuria rhizosphaerae TaxID=3376285 RepID=UPI0037B6A98D